MHGRGDVAGTPCVETHDDLCLASSNRSGTRHRALRLQPSSGALSACSASLERHFVWRLGWERDIDSWVSVLGMIPVIDEGRGGRAKPARADAQHDVTLPPNGQAVPAEKRDLPGPPK